MKREFLKLIASMLVLPATLLFSSANRTKILQAKKDNTLIETSDGSLSNARGPGIFVGRTGQIAGSIRRGLIAFDLSHAIPAGAKITSVSLTMHVTLSAGVGSSDVKLYRVLANWGAGTSESEGGRGDSATSGDATWLHTFYPNKKWQHPGGDFQSSPSAVQSVDGAGNYTWTSPQMLEDVQTWLKSPARNFGWIILGDESKAATAKVFASLYNPDTTARPMLTVEFSSPGR